jgi:hypothetical protein
MTTFKTNTIMKKIKDFTSYIVDINTVNRGMQVLFRFPNNFGISLVCHSFSYGNDSDEFEIAIINYNSEDNDDWDIFYTTELTQDVLGYQSKEDVIDVIQKTIAL